MTTSSSFQQQLSLLSDEEQRLLLEQVSDYTREEIEVLFPTRAEREIALAEDYAECFGGGVEQDGGATRTATGELSDEELLLLGAAVLGEGEGDCSEDGFELRGEAAPGTEDWEEHLDMFDEPDDGAVSEPDEEELFRESAAANEPFVPEYEPHYEPTSQASLLPRNPAVRLEMRVPSRRATTTAVHGDIVGPRRSGGPTTQRRSNGYGDLRSMLSQSETPFMVVGT